MKLRSLRAAMCVACVLSLAGCDTFGPIGDTVSGWFSSKKTSKLKGERISVLAADTSLKPDPDLSKTPVMLPRPYVNTDWPEPGGYAANAMYHLEANGPLRTIWETDTGKGSDDDSRLTAPPIVADGRVYVLDAQAHVFAFDARDGRPLWDRVLAPGQNDDDFWNVFNVFGVFSVFGSGLTIDPSKGFGGGTAFDDGKLFVSTGFGDVFAVDAATGKQLWKADLEVPIVNAPVANGGRVFVSSEDNHFVALAESDGRVLWDHQGIAESAGILSSTSAAVSGDTVIVPYTSGELYALRIDNGTPEWNDMLTKSGTVTALSELDDIAGRPVVDRNMVFAISHSGTMAAINLDTGDRVWTRNVGGIQTPWAAGDYVYVLTTDGQLLCLARKDGQVKWIHQLQRWENPKDKSDPVVWSGPVLVSNRLILVSSNGKAISVSPYTGDLLGRVDIPDGTYIPPVVANGTLYLLTNNAQLVAMH
jgi:outer membrane protein assembly factor BamB